MVDQNILDPDDYRRKKINFWFIWTIGNAVGAAIGWALGEIIGRSVSTTMGFRFGILIAGLIFEISVWLPRILVSHYFRELKLLGFLEKVVWITTEGFVWFSIDAFTSTQPAYFTLGASFAIILGGMMSVLFSIMGLSKAQRSKPKRKKTTIWWAVKTFVITLLGLIGISILSSIIMALSMEIGEIIQSINTAVGWAISGLSFGCGVGTVTGFAYLNLINRRKSMPA